MKRDDSPSVGVAGEQQRAGDHQRPAGGEGCRRGRCDQEQTCPPLEGRIHDFISDKQNQRCRAGQVQRTDSQTATAARGR